MKDQMPLAARMRPQTLDEFVGQEHLLGSGKIVRKMVESGNLFSAILWGPPGSGKTTLARLLASHTSSDFYFLSAVAAGVADIRKVVAQAREELNIGKKSVLFLDEIHRLNKAQQDVLLPHVEEGVVTLLGATTENPSFEVIGPLLSRARVLVLKSLSSESIQCLIQRALGSNEGLDNKYVLDDKAMSFLIGMSQGDARVALNILEIAASLASEIQGEKRLISLPIMEEAFQKKMLLYDKTGEEHYNIISAFIKSMRGSDPDAALYWCARMLEAGEDPLFIARRMVIFASEDIGNADPQALVVALATMQAVDFVGMPEARINLAQGVTYLATAPKSNASYKAIESALGDVKKYGKLDVPLYLRNAPTKLMKELGYAKGYQYPHNYKNAEVDQVYKPKELERSRYYVPSGYGFEKIILERINKSKK